MTHEEFQTKLLIISNEQLAQMADEALSKLCKTGARSFTMSVPPKITDTDMIFSQLIKRFKEITED